MAECFCAFLCICFIVFTEGFYDGMAQQVKDAMVDTEIGGGQFWQKDYDPLIPFL